MNQAIVLLSSLFELEKLIKLKILSIDIIESTRDPIQLVSIPLVDLTLLSSALTDRDKQCIYAILHMAILC